MNQTASSTARRRVTIAGLVAITMLLSSCFRADFSFSINDDGTADVAFLTLIDTEQLEEFAALLGEDTSSFEGLSGAELLEQLSEGDDPCGDVTGGFEAYDVQIEEISDGSEVGVECTISGVPIAELNDIGEDSSISIEQDADGTRFAATLGGVDELTGDAQDGPDLGALLGVSIDELFSISFAVSAPGSLGDNNASSTSGSTATWNITADASFVTNGDAVMNAEWTPGGSSDSSTWIIVAIVVVLAALVAIGFFVVRGRNGTPTPATPDGAMAPPMPTAPLSTTPPPPPSTPPSAVPPPPPPPPASPPPPPPPPS